MLNLGNVNFNDATAPNTLLKVVAPTVAGLNSIGPSKLTDDGTTLSYNGTPISGGGTGITGTGTTGSIPKFASASSVGNSAVDDGVTVVGTVTSTKPVAAPYVQAKTIYSAAGTPLPAASVALKGARATVSDATTPTFLATYASGGAVICPVFCDGTNWLTA